jgi:DNA repair protein RecO (recombination protein O)
MELKKSEGVILHIIKYGEHDQILTVFTREEGLIKLILKGNRKNRKADLLMRAEFIYLHRQNSLMTCREWALLTPYLQLRKSFACLEGACAIAKAVLKSQCEQKASPQLYELLIYYLEKLPAVKQPEAFVASFLLKILRHEGLLGLTPHCSVCRQNLTDHYIFNGESYCERDRPPQSIALSPFDAEKIFILAFSRSFVLIESQHLKSELQTHIHDIFLELTGH